MSYVLNQYVTQNAYTAAGQIHGGGIVRLVVNVNGAPVLMQLGDGLHGIGWRQEEIRLAPAVYTLERPCDAIRFRSASAGTPGTVDVEAATSADVGGP